MKQHSTKDNQAALNAFCGLLDAILGISDYQEHPNKEVERDNKKLFKKNCFEFSTDILTMVKSGDHLGFNLTNTVSFVNKGLNIVHLVKDNYKDGTFTPVDCHLNNKPVKFDDIESGCTYALVSNPQTPWNSFIGFCKYIGNDTIYIVDVRGEEVDLCYQKVTSEKILVNSPRRWLSFATRNTIRNKYRKSNKTI